MKSSACLRFPDSHRSDCKLDRSRNSCMIHEQAQTRCLTPRGKKGAELVNPSKHLLIHSLILHAGPQLSERVVPVPVLAGGSLIMRNSKHGQNERKRKRLLCHEQQGPDFQLTSTRRLKLQTHSVFPNNGKRIGSDLQAFPRERRLRD